jgi:hypothetical protein
LPEQVRAAAQSPDPANFPDQMCGLTRNNPSNSLRGYSFDLECEKGFGYVCQYHPRHRHAECDRRSCNSPGRRELKQYLNNNMCTLLSADIRVTRRRREDIPPNRARR